MKLEWMGRYRNLVYELIYYSNTSNRTGGTFDAVDGVSLNKLEYQTLENICEHEDEDHIMTDIAKDLGIVQSSVTKATKKLLGLGLIAKYKFKNDRKSIVLKPTENGRKVYTGIYKNSVEPVFSAFFEALEDFSDEDLRKFEQAVLKLSFRWNGLVDRILEKVEA